jgi:hypothetical protein
LSDHDEPPWPDDDFEDECGLGDDGQCALAGTEHCDFECIYRDSDLFAGSAAWCRKHPKAPA